MISRVLACIFLIGFSQKLIAESNSCYIKTNDQIETCHTTSLAVESSCELKIIDTTNQEALDLVNKHSKQHITESAFAVLILQGSKYKDSLAKYKSDAELCQKDLAAYKNSCENLKTKIQSCEDSEDISNNDSENLNKSLFYISEKKFSKGQENISEIFRNIEKLEFEIAKTANDLCKQGFDKDQKFRDCENPSEDLTKKIQNAFENCAKENIDYNKLECLNTVKPSLNGDFARPANLTASSTSNEALLPQSSISEKSSSSELDLKPVNTREKIERSIANDTSSPASPETSSKVKKADIDGSEKNELNLLKQTPSESASKIKNSEFKWPSLDTIFKAVIIYGALTGKLKKWIDKLFVAINPYAESNTRSPSSSGGSSSAGGSGCYGSFRGTIDMPPQDERIIARNIKIRSLGKQVTGNPAVDNAATGGGSPDGGMFLTGSFYWETDANCRVISGTAYIFGHPFSITGAINKDRTFNLSYLGPMPGYITSNNLVKGKLQHGGGEEYIYGYLNGQFTPKK